MLTAFALVALAWLAAGCGGPADRAAAPLSAEAVWTWPTWAISSPSAVPVPGGRARAALAAGSVRRPRERSATAQWTELNLALVSSRGTVDPPRASRGYALVSVAMYDAVVSASYWRHRRDQAHGGPYPSVDAAVAGAASRVLAYLFPERPEASFDRLAEQSAEARVRDGSTSPGAARAGLALGRAVAERVIRHARTDGADRVVQSPRPHGAAFWAPVAGTGQRPIEPSARNWRGWVITSGAQFRAPAPPAFGSARYLAEARELVRLRRHLTPAQKRIAKFWEGGVGSPLPPGVWNEVALAYVRRDRMNTADAARVFALLNVAMADTGIATWDTKYAYWTARPENAIRSLGLARNWKPFLATPAFPSYVSAHSAYSGAASEVLAAIFPKDAAAFRAKARQAGLSRLYGGIHFRSDHVAGIAIGRKIGRLVIEHWRPAKTDAVHAR